MSPLKNRKTTHKNAGRPKKVNDSFGHQVGDTVLKEVANVFNVYSRDSDIAARYGGEEFVILLPNTSHDKAVLFAERLRKCTEAKHFSSMNRKVTISLGVSSFPVKGINVVNDLLRSADEALYSAKENGRNKVVSYKAL